MNQYKKIKNFDQLIELEHGEIGMESRAKYEVDAQIFVINEMLKIANYKQERRTEKTRNKKPNISK